MFLLACGDSPGSGPGSAQTGREPAASLERSDDGKAVLGFLQCEDFDCTERLAAVVARGPSVVPLLHDLLRSADLATLVGDSELGRTRVLLALGELRDRSSSGPVARMTTDADPVVRAAAAEAIGKIGSDDAVAVLGPLLRDRDSNVRERAALALARLGRPDALPVLRSAANIEPDQAARAALAEAIRRSSR